MNLLQLNTQAIDVTNWMRDEEFAEYPEGARAQLSTAWKSYWAKQAVHQLQTEQYLAIEKQYAQLQQAITACRQQVQHHEQQLFKRDIELQKLQNEHRQLQEAHAELIKAPQGKTQLLSGLQERCDQQQKIIPDLEQELIGNKNHMLAMARELAILAEQKSNMQKTLIQLEDKRETLRHKKTFSIQEKSELQGHLKLPERGTKSYETVSV